MVNTTTYRKDFTDEERIAYNKYMVSRMQVFRKTEHGRQVVNANNRKAYYKRKAKLLEERLRESAPPIE
jgi:hypothetical protein